MAEHGVVEAGFIELDGAGGMGDVLEVELEGGVALGLADGAEARADGGEGELGDDGLEFEEEVGDLAALGEFGEVVDAEVFDTQGVYIWIRSTADEQDIHR